MWGRNNDGSGSLCWRCALTVSDPIWNTDSRSPAEMYETVAESVIWKYSQLMASWLPKIATCPVRNNLTAARSHSSQICHCSTLPARSNATICQNTCKTTPQRIEFFQAKMMRFKKGFSNVIVAHVLVYIERCVVRALPLQQFLTQPSAHTKSNHLKYLKND